MGKFGMKLRQFMYGRYGYDKLSYALLILSVILSLILFKIKNIITSAVILLPMLIAIYRAMSRNIPARAKENRAFEKFAAPIAKYFTLQKNKLRDRKTHRYIRCPKCSNSLRLPRGRGAIIVHCPVCGESFDART